MILLSKHLDHALRVIADKKQEGLRKSDIDALLAANMITPDVRGGWRLNSKGREYIKRVKK